MILEEAEALLDRVSDIDGFMLACLVDASTGMVLASRKEQLSGALTADTALARNPRIPRTGWAKLRAPTASERAATGRMGPAHAAAAGRRPRPGGPIRHGGQARRPVRCPGRNPAGRESSGPFRDHPARAGPAIRPLPFGADLTRHRVADLPHEAVSLPVAESEHDPMPGPVADQPPAVQLIAGQPDGSARVERPETRNRRALL